MKTKIRLKKIMLSILLAIILIFLISIMGHERPNNSKTSDPNKLQVVVSNFASYDFLRAIIGEIEDVQITFLLGAGKDAHSYEPTSQDLIKIQKSDLFVYVGKGLEPWTEKVVQVLDKNNKKVICITDNLELLEEKEIDETDIHNEEQAINNNIDGNNSIEGVEEGHIHEKGAFDEHVWTSPTNAIKMVRMLERALEEVDSANAESYKENAENYIKKIQQVKEQIQVVIDNRVRNKLIFGDKMPMQYFIEEYNLDVSAAFNGCSTETDPNSRTIAYLVDTVKEENIPVVLYCELGLGKVAKTIVAEAQNGALAMQIQTLHNISKEDFENGETWVSLMTRNIEVLKKALQ